jgi:hypothetical protein
VAGLLLWTLFLYLTLVMPRYIRLKVQQAEDKIAPLAPQGTEQYRRLFQPISYTAPPILLAVLIAASFAGFISTVVAGIAGPLEWLYQLVNLPLTYLTIGATLWAYFAALWGLYRLGNQPLNLKHAVESHKLVPLAH